jgi:hypothetical protein
MRSELERDSQQVTSVEYAVTNVAYPRLESDWIPILPIDAKGITAERFLPDLSGRGYFRFPADPDYTVRLSRNGRFIKVPPEYTLKAASSNNIIGLTLPAGEFGFDDIFTVDYMPNGDQTVVSFETRGFSDNIPLVAAYDESGAGEGYGSTSGRNEVDLQHAPWIDTARVADSHYHHLGGHIGYSPIVVMLSDKRLAINMTNYGPGAQGELPPASVGYYYFHAGRTLLFNQRVENFRVFYQFLQTAVRFRTVLRVNDKDFVSPSVDFVHIKAKTRRANARRD